MCAPSRASGDLQRLDGVRGESVHLDVLVDLLHQPAQSHPVPRDVAAGPCGNPAVVVVVARSPQLIEDLGELGLGVGDRDGRPVRREQQREGRDDEGRETSVKEVESRRAECGDSARECRFCSCSCHVFTLLGALDIAGRDAG